MQNDIEKYNHYKDDGYITINIFSECKKGCEHENQSSSVCLNVITDCEEHKPKEEVYLGKKEDCCVLINIITKCKKNKKCVEINIITDCD